MSKELGLRGERIAARFLSQRGYTIITTRWLKRVGEIDIVAYDSSTKELVFVEVKTRTSTAYGWPEESVTGRKLEKITKTAEWFLLEKKYPPSQEWRIDVVSIIVAEETNSAHISHFKRVET